MHLSGKTCVGKSTLADALSIKFGYNVVRLDEIVNDVVIGRFAPLDRGSVFIEVYRNRNKLDWIRLFINETQTRISTILEAGGRVMIEGAIANEETLGELFKPFAGWWFLYLHPQDMERYRANLTSRFVLTTQDFHAGLPRKFWDMVDEEEFAKFCATRQILPGIVSSIDRYASSSQHESVASSSHLSGDVRQPHRDRRVTSNCEVLIEVARCVVRRDLAASAGCVVPTSRSFRQRVVQHGAQV